MLRLPVALFLLALISEPAMAASASSVPDLSKLKCEDPLVVAFIKESIKGMKFTDGAPVSPYLGNNSRMHATTVSAERTKLVCNVGVSFNFGGGERSLRGKFIIRILPSGKASIVFDPLY